MTTLTAQLYTFHHFPTPTPSEFSCCFVDALLYSFSVATTTQFSRGRLARALKGKTAQCSKIREITFHGGKIGKNVQLTSRVFPNMCALAHIGAPFEG